MSEAWYAAFALLALLSLANAVVLLAAMRQIGVLFQRIHPTGALEEEGPAVFRRVPRLDLTPVAGSPALSPFSRPITVLAYVTPNCGACDLVVPLVHAFARNCERDVFYVALATDAAPDQASLYGMTHEVKLPFARHDFFSAEYDIKASPYILALARGEEDDGAHAIVVGGGIVNTLEQIEDIARQATENLDIQRGVTPAGKVMWQEVEMIDGFQTPKGAEAPPAQIGGSSR
jgi:hypothetical protein